MAVKPISINKFDGGLNLTTGSNIGDNQFTIANNVFYNTNRQLETRRGYKTFGNAIGTNKPITSYFFFQRDDNLHTLALCASGTDMYLYDELSTSRSSIKTGLSEYEIIKTDRRTRRDFAVYKNIVYLTNGVDKYASFNGTATPAYLNGGALATSTLATRQAAGLSSFKIGIDGTDYQVGTISFASATSMDDVAAYIQFAIRTATGRLETCVWSTNHFIITSTNKTTSSAVTVTSQSTLGGTDISGAGATAFMDSETGRGAAVAVSNGYTEYTKAKIRYINMNTDILYGSGDDSNPSTLYFSAVAPADGSSFDTNDSVIGGDELGRINGMNILGKLILIFKANKIYTFDATANSGAGAAEAIDSQTGGFSDRTIANVGNSLVYLTNRGVDTLKPRTGLDGSSALESSPLDEDVRALTSKIEELNLNSNTALYIKGLNNYYMTFDKNNDNIPDTTLVYSSLAKAWTKYDYVPIYDYGFYIDKDGNYQYIFTSAVSDQVYEMETGFDDNGETIEYEIETKAFDFGEPGTYKTFEYVDIIGQKSKGTQIMVDIKIDGEIVGGAIIDDTKVTSTQSVQILGTRPIGLDTITGEAIDDMPMYNYLIRVPFYSTGPNISINMHSEGGVRILEKMRIGVNGEPIDVFSSVNIG